MRVLRTGRVYSPWVGLLKNRLFRSLLTAVLCTTLAFSPMSIYALPGSTTQPRFTIKGCIDAIRKHNGEVRKESLQYARDMSQRIWSDVKSAFNWRKIDDDDERSVRNTNAMKLSPFAIVPAALATGGDMGSAVLSATTLSTALFSLDATLDDLIENANKVMTPTQLVLLIAGGTNVLELFAATGASINGDGVFVSPSTPVGSNMANFGLMGAAIFAGLHARAVKEGIIEPHENLFDRSNKKKSTRRIVATLKSIDRKIWVQEFGAQGAFMVSALVFQAIRYYESHTALVAWVALNLGYMIYYFKSSILSKPGKYKAVLDQMNDEEVDSMISSLESEGSEEAQRAKGFFEDLRTLRANEDDTVNEVSEIMARVRDVSAELNSNPEYNELLGGIMDQNEAYGIQQLFQLESVKVKRPRAREALRRIYTRLVLGVSAMIIISPTIDFAVNHMTAAIPILTKAIAGTLIVATISSLPEFFGVSKLLRDGKTRSAFQIMTVSDRINIAIACLAIMLAIMI